MHVSLVCARLEWPLHPKHHRTWLHYNTHHQTFPFKNSDLLSAMYRQIAHTLDWKTNLSKCFFKHLNLDKRPAKAESHCGTTTGKPHWQYITSPWQQFLQRIIPENEHQPTVIIWPVFTCCQFRQRYKRWWSWCVVSEENDARGEMENMLLSVSFNAARCYKSLHDLLPIFRFSFFFPFFSFCQQRTEVD